MWRRSAWAVLAVTLVHDLEELATVPAALARPPLAPLLRRRGISPSRAWSAFSALNWAVSAAATAAVVLGLRRGRPGPPTLVAATMLVNVAVPHLPAALRARGYTPGLISAVALVLPVTARHLLLARRQGALTATEMRRLLAAASGLVVLGLPIALVTAARLAREPDGPAR